MHFLLVLASLVVGGGDIHLLFWNYNIVLCCYSYSHLVSLLILFVVVTNSYIIPCDYISNVCLLNLKNISLN